VFTLDEILGGLGRPLQATVSRELEEVDLTLLSILPDGVLEKTTPAVARLRHSHHLLARLLAEGRRPNECAMITGYSPSRISILQNDPTFQDLVSSYRSQVQEIYVSVHERRAQLGVDSIEELQARLDEHPEKFSIADLQEMMKLTMDRSGHGPTAQVKHTHHVITPEILEKIKAEAARRQLGSVRALDVSNDSRPGDGVLLEGRAELEGEASEGQQSQGE